MENKPDEANASSDQEAPKAISVIASLREAISYTIYNQQTLYEIASLRRATCAATLAMTE
jgi:hypothetical protein